jgi:hypothetical protein
LKLLVSPAVRCGHYYGPGRQRQQQSQHLAQNFVAGSCMGNGACQLKGQYYLIDSSGLCPESKIGVIAWEAVAKGCRNVQITQTYLFDGLSCHDSSPHTSSLAGTALWKWKWTGLWHSL